MVNECLAEGHTDPSAIQNIMSVFNAIGGNSSQDSQENFKSTKDMYLPELINLPMISLIGELMED